MKRVTSIDAVRGLVMLIMAVDHLRDFIHVSALVIDPVDLKATTAPLFATRWITHLCAPTFVFLSGVSAYLSYVNSKDKKSSRQFLWKRGLWLIVLEFTIVNFGVWLNIHFEVIILQVIAAIGCGFILLSVFLDRSPKQNIIVAALIIMMCNFVVGLDFPDYPVANFFYHWMFSPRFYQVTPHFALFIPYPVLPWFGIMLAGYAGGILFMKPAEERMGLFVKISAGLFLLFLIIRAVNVFGDPAPFTVQKDWVFTVFSFINVSKYPPSLLYTLVTLSIAFFFLFCSEKFQGKWKDILMVYGAVPMFYYLLHFYLLHLAAIVVFLFQGFAWSELSFGALKFGRPETPSGVGLGYVYLIWLVIVVLLYPLCKQFAAYKKVNPHHALLRYI